MANLMAKIYAWTWRCLSCGDQRESGDKPTNCTWCAGTKFALAKVNSEVPKPEVLQFDGVVEFHEIVTCAICGHEKVSEKAICGHCQMRRR